MHAVNAELASENSDLRRIIVKRWHVENRRKAITAISEGLNEKRGPEAIAKLLEAFGSGRHMSFRYTKPDGSSRIRQVSVWKVTGNLLKARDLEDGQIKSFQLDNISDAQAIEYR
jgi:predicted DNA-binding transcriptional regulator YafY